MRAPRASTGGAIAKRSPASAAPSATSRPTSSWLGGDDQYENFREDGVPPFCVFALDAVECRPHAPRGIFDGTNVWDEPVDTVVTVRGHREGGVNLASALLDAGFDMAYAYRVRHERGLPHAFINTVMFLDYERCGFDVPMVPFHVNCYGSSVISKRGGFAHLDGKPVMPDPAGPTPRRCFEVGAAARALRRSPWRVAMIASSCWSHLSTALSPLPRAQPDVSIGSSGSFAHSPIEPS